MFKKILYPLFLFSFFVYSQQTKEVLFIGNSYTFTYDLPNTTKLLANSARDNLIYDSNAIGWYSLTQHANAPICQQKIENNNWDHVVLQEFSTYPAYNYLSFYSGAEKLVTTISNDNPCKNSTILFMTWGRQNDASMPYYEMQNATKNSYNDVATRLGTEVSPVGIAWKKVRDDGDLINLYKPDGSHQSFAGTYLAACVFYATIFDKTPVGLTYKGSLNQTDATYLQEKAFEAYNEYLAMGLIHNTNAIDSIEDVYRVNVSDSESELNSKIINSPNSIETAANINYTGLSNNAVKTPVLNYIIKQNGNIVGQENIPVILNLNTSTCNNITSNLPFNIDISNVAIGNFELDILLNNKIHKSFSLNKTTTLSTIDVDDGKASVVKVFPNPVDDNLYITINNTVLDNDTSINIYNTLGQNLIKSSIKNQQEKVLNVTNLIPGVYFIKIKSGNAIFSQKLIKKN